MRLRTNRYTFFLLESSIMQRRIHVPRPIAQLLLGSLLCATAQLHAQTPPALKLQSIDIRVSNPDQSLQFYHDLLGLQVQGRVGKTLWLRIGVGPQFIALSPAHAGESARIAAIGLSVQKFAAAKFTQRLDAAGFSRKQAAPDANLSELSLANSYWSEGRALYFVDQEGLPMRLADARDCGAWGAKQVECKSMHTKKEHAGQLPLLGINHLTTFVANAPRANQFMLDLFGLKYQFYQGPTAPTVGIGDGLQFLMFVGGAQSGPAKEAARINHVSFSMNKFDVEQIFATLKSYGLSPRPEGARVAPPLTYYVSMRMPNRGGAEDGTPEVYFTDPDGILLQVQDTTYCGGGGYLGDKC
jgi:catechol 2,3-dioxygenase-like lactoylglutathione lyase family enzyme